MLPQLCELLNRYDYVYQTTRARLQFETFVPQDVTFSLTIDYVVSLYNHGEIKHNWDAYAYTALRCSQVDRGTQNFYIDHSV